MILPQCPVCLLRELNMIVLCEHVAYVVQLQNLLLWQLGWVLTHVCYYAVSANLGAY